MMFKRRFRKGIFIQNILCAFLLFGAAAVNAAGQTPAEAASDLAEDSGPDGAQQQKSSAESINPPPSPSSEQTGGQQETAFKVTFDEETEGLLIIEANGKRYRVDANKKTVEPLAAEAADERKDADPVAAVPDTEAVAAAAEEDEYQEEEESVWNFEKGEEPFDYYIVNVPTPKSVPQGSWNLSFTHRFSQPLHPLSESGKNLLGFDSFSVSSFGVAYGITDRLYVRAARSPICQRGLCRTIEIGLGYHWLDQGEENSPVALSTYASVEGDENFSEKYTFNLQTMISRRIGKRLYLFFSPAVHINANGQGRFNPRAEDFFPPATQAVADFRLPKHTGSFGFGTAVMISPDLLGLFEFTPRVGFKLGRVRPLFDENFKVVRFENISEPAMSFGIQKNIGDHSFALTFSNTQTTTTSRYNSSNLTLKPRRPVIGFNLFRRF